MKEEKYDKIVVETQVLGEKTPQSCIQKKNAQKFGDAKKRKIPKSLGMQKKRKTPKSLGMQKRKKKNIEKKIICTRCWKKLRWYNINNDNNNSISFPNQDGPFGCLHNLEWPSQSKCGCYKLHR